MPLLLISCQWEAGSCSPCHAALAAASVIIAALAAAVTAIVALVGAAVAVVNAVAAGSAPHVIFSRRDYLIRLSQIFKTDGIRAWSIKDRRARDLYVNTGMTALFAFLRLIVTQISKASYWMCLSKVHTIRWCCEHKYRVAIL